MDSDSDSGSGFSMHDKLIIVHATFAGLAVMILVPAAIIFTRFLRLGRRTATSWFSTHSTLQFLALICIVIVFATGVSAVRGGGHGSQFTGMGKDTHHDLGLAIFIIFLVQAMIGIASHFTQGPNQLPTEKGDHTHVPSVTAPRNRLRTVHLLFGLATTAILYAQVVIGFDEWDMTSDSMTPVPQGVRDVFWILFGLEIGMYFAGYIFELARTRERKPETGYATNGHTTNGYATNGHATAV